MSSEIFKRLNLRGFQVGKQILQTKRVNWVLDADIRGFLDLSP